MRAIKIITGDTIRYRGKRYTIHGTAKLWNPVPIIHVIAVPKGQKYVLGKGKWKKIPGDHTVILERRTESPRGSWD